MMFAKKYQMKHPNAKWTECVKKGAKMYQSMKK